jgi:branched-chain amino acid transport system substrate-binding protein
MIRRLTILAALVVAAALPSAAAPLEPYTINAILSLTGSGAFLGHADAVALQAAEGVINRTGGIRGRTVHFVVADDQTSPAVAVQLADGLVAQHVAVMIGPALSAPCSAVVPIVSKAGPVEYCVSPGIHPAPNSFSFSTSMAVRDSVGGEFRYFHTRGWHRIALLTSTDATGQEGEQDVREAITRPENAGMTLVANEHFNTSDLSVGAQIARVQAANPDVFIAWATGTPFGNVLKQLAQTGYVVPVMSNSGNAITVQMEQYIPVLPKELYFSSVVGLGVQVLRPGPILEAVRQFNAALKMQGVTPDNGYTFAWDPAMILVDALRRLGPDATATQVRDYIEQLHGFAGINGVYDFRDGSQRGIGINTAMIVRWDPTDKHWIPVTRAGGLKL